MPMINPDKTEAVQSALQQHLNALEKATKTPGLQGDMEQVAKKVYEQLDKLLRGEQGLEANLLNLTLGAAKGRFHSPLGIPEDLTVWLKTRIPPDSSSYTWYGLCTHQIKN